MIIDFYKKLKLPIIIPTLVILAFFYGCNQNSSSENNTSSQEIYKRDTTPNQLIAIAPPPFSDEYIFPCSDCHSDMEVNTQPRILEMHEEIVEMFNHDSENRWCLDCHDANNRDNLHFASGKLIKFEESYKLCGQCHGDKLRDWKVGVHGKRTGEWNGTKQYLLCVNCHNPHSPKFKKLTPKPPPVRQEEMSFKNK